MCLGSFCMCLKRKNHDVLPPPEAFVDKTYEKYRFDPEEGNGAVDSDDD